MWAFWVSFVIFLAEPRQVLEWWPLPTIDRVASPQQPLLAACINVALVAVFGLQHSMMARPWFKRRVMGWIPGGLERATYVHMANTALFILILLWQPITTEVWNVEDSAARDVLWLLFGAGWVILSSAHGLLACGSCSALIRFGPGPKAGPTLRASEPAFSTGGCAIPCTWASCWASGPRRG
jgi:hypothetical protein